jgi:hypothetical protein
MLKIGRSVLVLAVLFAAAPAAHAQSPFSGSFWKDKTFINANAGYQVTSEDVDSASDFTVYDEAASLTGQQSLESAPIFDVSAGYRLGRTWAVAVGLSRYSNDGPLRVSALVPHPAFYDQLRTVNVVADGARHSELAVNLMYVYLMPMTRKIDLAFSAGPSIIAVKQDIVSAIAIEPEAGPSFSSPTVTDITVTEQRKTAIGINVGADAAYMFSPRYGVGFTVQYLWGSADIDGTTDSVKVGGLQALAGLRLRL